MATLKHINSKNADYGAAEQYLLFEHDEFTVKPVLDETGRLIPREDYRLSTLNCGGEDFAVACMRANLRYEKNQRREDVKSHHYRRHRERLPQLCRRCPYVGRPGQKGSRKTGRPRLLIQGGREPMNTTFSEMIDRLTATTPEQEDYTGEDGLLYCGKCHKPKEAYFAPDKAAIFGRDRHPAECDCQRAAREEREAAEKRQKHLDTVEDLKRRGFTDPAMRDWTFENDNGQNPQAIRARNYVKNWERAYAGNVGCLFWGSVGTGKSYLAGCIANALMEKEIPVYMTNFALILNDLAASFEGRNEYISRLCRYPLLILDDFGMERGTEYGLEQVFHVIDSRYRSRKPLIVTTNLTLSELQHPKDTAHSRIYDRVLEMCPPVCCTGGNFRKKAAQDKLGLLKELMNE